MSGDPSLYNRHVISRCNCRDCVLKRAARRDKPPQMGPNLSETGPLFVGVDLASCPDVSVERTITLQDMIDLRHAREREAAQSVLDTFGSSYLSQQSPEYRALVDEVRKWMPVAAGGMGIDNLSGQKGPWEQVYPAPHLKPADPPSKPTNEALGRAISQPQAMRVGVFTFDR
jgi:hypothetical protein